MKRLARCLLCLCIAFPAASAAEELGRLFHSPAERAALDAARQAGRQQPAGSAPAQVRIDGYVRRTDGRSTVWVNGVARMPDSPAGDVRVAPRADRPGVVAVQIGGDTSSVEVRVGSATALESGTRP